MAGQNKNGKKSVAELNVIVAQINFAIALIENSEKRMIVDTLNDAMDRLAKVIESNPGGQNPGAGDVQN